ncbi:3-isopropylmalate dehydratase small subunit [Thermaurantiacus sp.]
MAEPVVRVTSAAIPLVRDNVDTDIIIPSREMTGTGRGGLADGLFANWRYSDPAARVENPDFPLNRPEYRKARILKLGANAGCGSSREHAAWALHQWGIRVVIAPSFNPIFFRNCVANGIVPVVLSRALLESLADPVTVDLGTMQVNDHPFTLAEEARAMLMLGLDPIALTLREAAAIAAWQEQDHHARPWAWLSPRCQAEAREGPEDA